MTDDRLTDDRWLTYAEAAEILGLTSEAVRALARRKRWPRRSPNAIGGQAWVLVPADRLTDGHGGVSANGHSETIDGQRESGRRSESLLDRPLLALTDGRPAAADGHEADGRRASVEQDDRRSGESDRRSTEILTAVQEVAGMLREQIAGLKAELAVEQDRANQAEDRVRELQATIDEQTVEHRRVVEALVSRIPVPRRSWWCWRRR